MLAIEIESTLTDRYQTTVPDTVRRILKLGQRDKIHLGFFQTKLTSSQNDLMSSKKNNFTVGKSRH